jgi:dipeptidyl aminopeptidase/acylaminoacyl peptidase
LRQLVRTFTEVLIGLALGSILMGIVTAETTLHTRRRAIPQAADARALAGEIGSTWEAVQVAAADGAVLHAWLFTPPVPGGSAVILLHGVGDTRAGMLDHAEYLLRSGFCVLLPDSRGHGESGGAITTYGIEESGDLARWSDWLLQTHHVERLYGLGVSLGAGILLQSLARETRFRAVVAESPFSTFPDVAYDRLSQESGIPRQAFWLVIQSGFVYSRLRYGVDLRRASPADTVRATHTPILLIHGTADVNIPIGHSRALHALNPVATQLWEVPGAKHVQVMSDQPEKYARTVVEWFRAHP